MITLKKTMLITHLNRFALILLVSIFTSTVSFGQDTITKKTPNEPVTDTYNTGTFLENQTCITNPAKTIELIINHRFGKMKDGSKELWGIYSPSNIRMGLNYSITDYLTLGMGTTKFNKQQDINLKLRLLRQTTNGTIPVSVSYYGNIVMDARDTKSFDYANFKELHRFSTFSEIMISRRFCKNFNLQLAPMYSHYNVVESANDSIADPVRKNDNFGLSVIGKLNVTSVWSFFFEYDHNFTKILKETTLFTNPRPNVACGFEAFTGTHSFQIFVSTAADLSNQRNMVYNTSPFFKTGSIQSGIAIGFNITRMFY